MIRLYVIAVMVLTVVLSGCSQEVCVFEDEKSCSFQNVTSIDFKPNTIVMIYLSGSLQENISDPCYPDEEQSGFGVPVVLKQTATILRQEYPVKLMGYCTPTKKGDFHADNLDGEPKVVKRSQDIIELLESLENQGVNPNRIFLIGHSAGGWAALLAKRAKPQSSRAVIALAPAFAGKTMLRPPEWTHLRTKLSSQLLNAIHLQSYIVAFEKDEFENTETLAFLRRVAGVEFKSLGGDDLRTMNCPHKPMHYLVQHPCMQDLSKPLSKYIKKTLSANPFGF